MLAQFFCHVCGKQISIEIDNWDGLELSSRSCPKCGNSEEFCYVAKDAKTTKIKLRTRLDEDPETEE